MWFKSEVVLSIVKTILLIPFTCFSLKKKKVLFAHAHCQYSSVGFIARFRTLVMTDEVFELSYKKSFWSLDVDIETMYILVC